ncbi:metallophosphoesterase [Aquibacillus salsiterrae]|uniref:Metallophosphoesterase n=1 Tax=Aquibacillus salsiterrae TaxID=2950439 RepID=A0A9X4AEV8_9BACI|nr:metallophosphoesterase [Aquibacillus salsiterrae]MDC3415403.1 metallophosphoesterase [Aquibacillus salsiterrae]
MIVTIIVVLCSLTSLFFYMLYKAHHDVLDDRPIFIEGKSNQKLVNLFFISDIHRRVINQKTLDLVPLDIDFVVIGGDLLESGVPLANARENIKRLKQLQAPIYFIWGNNDYETNIQAFKRMLYNEGVYILKNQVFSFQVNNKHFNLIGLDYYKKGKPKYDFSWLQATEDAYNILLTHDPRAFNRFSDKEIEHIHLVLSGHTHGGQIRFFGFGPYEKGGLKFVRKTPIFISEGYGYTKLPLRLGTNAECHILRLK